MRTLIVHTERDFLGGAERMLGYYTEELLRQNRPIAVTVTPGTRLEEFLPPAVQRIPIPDNQQFNPMQLWRQVRKILASRTTFSFDLIHGWMARSWELAGLVGRLSRRPALGTLHDHPEARFISSQRRRLMYWASRLGLTRVICVSHAVLDACKKAGYPEGKLSVIHNGLPIRNESANRLHNATFHIGFLGVLSERKGIEHLLKVLDQFALKTARPWTLSVAGGAQGAYSQNLVDRLQQEYSSRPWWPQVRWLGWCRNPMDFLRSLDILVCPSCEFDPFPTVLLEAGQVGTPVLAAHVGGVSEIVVHEQTGWLYNPADIDSAAQVLKILANDIESCQRAGKLAATRIREEFSIQKMVANHERIYSNSILRQ